MKCLWLVLLASGCAKPVAPAVSTSTRGPPIAAATPGSAGAGALATSASTSAAARGTPPPASSAAGACVASSALDRWQSLYGVSLGLTRDWNDVTEYSFYLPGEQQRHLSWRADREATPAFAEHSRKRIVELFGNEAGRSVGKVRTTKTALGAVHHFEVLLGRTPDAEALAFAVIPRAAAGISLHFRGTRRDLAGLPALLASLEAMPDGSLLAPPGRHSVYGLSFSWPEPLESPKYFMFESENRARFRVHWDDAQPAFEDADWGRNFSLPEAPAPSATRIKHGAVPGAAVCPPPGFEQAAVTFRVFAQEGRAKNYEGISKLHLFAQARAEVGKRFLSVEYFDEAPDVSPLERFYALLRTVHAELPR